MLESTNFHTATVGEHPCWGTGTMDWFYEGDDDATSGGEPVVLRESVGAHPWRGQRRLLSVSSSCGRACRHDFLSKAKRYGGRTELRLIRRLGIDAYDGSRTTGLGFGAEYRPRRLLLLFFFSREITITSG